MKRRVIAILLTFIMLFSLTPSAFAVIAYENSFSDTENHWAKPEIEKWSAKGLLMGSDGTFRPNDKIKRAEMAVIIDRLMNYQEAGENIYADLDDTWYTDAILKNSEMGVIKGADGLVRPVDSITREEAVVMLSRAFEIEKISGDTLFVDDSQVSSWSKEHIKAFSSLGYIKGKPGGTFSPRNSITRAEVVKIIDNMVAGWINESGEFTGDFDGTVIINTEGVTLKDATISNDLIIAQGVAEGEVNLDNVIIKGNTFVKGGGENSVYFNDVEVKGELKVAKPDGKIRIVASGTTSISITKLASGALLVEQELIDGGFETVIIPAEAIGNEITIQGDCKDIQINTDDITIIIDKRALVEDMLITGDNVEVMVKGKVTKIDIPTGTKDTVINGSGKVEKVLTDGEGTDVTTYDTEITTGQNSKGVVARGKEVVPGEAGNTGKKPSSGGGGSTSSSNYIDLVLTALNDETVTINGAVTVLNAAPTAGDGSYTYKWYSCDDTSKTNPVEIVDQTNATFTPKSDIFGTYYYYCEVTETTGDNEVIGTNVMTLVISVNIINIALELPELNDETVPINGAVTSLNAAPTTGDGSYTYKWYSCDDTLKTNKVEIVDQTNAIFTPKSDIFGTYYYYCEVTETTGDNEVVTTNAVTIDIVEMLGVGTVADPFQIETIEDLVAVGKAAVIDGFNDYSLSSNYILNNNLDFIDDNSYRNPNGLDILDVDNDGNNAELLKNALINSEGGAGFDPIGDATNKFTGNFDGDGHTINNLYINRSTIDYVGLFGYAFNSTIDEINLVDVDITGKSYIGSLVGYNYADGIDNTSTISNSYALGTVDGESYIGGLVGDSNSNAGGTATISNSYTQVEVTGSGPLVGGLVGHNYANAGTSTIKNSYALGNVESDSLVGGLVGENYTDGGTAMISNSYALGVVEGNFSVGGLVGDNYVNGGTCTISNSIAFNPSVTGNGNVGRVIGSNNGTITNNYANGSMIVAGTVGSGDAGTDMTADDFSNITSTNPYSTWDFTNTWEIKTDADRPTLIGVGNDAGEIIIGEISTKEMLGAGTVADPFQIETIEDLVAVGKATVIDDNNDYSLSSNYILNNNLDFTDDNSYSDPNGLDILDVDNDGNNAELLKNAVINSDGGAGFDPIGDATNKFTGNFDGDGHTINKLYINRNTEEYIGLFGYAFNSTIENIGLVDVIITGKNAVGGLVGHNYAFGIGSAVTISNSYVLGDVNGDIYVGGLAGYNRVDTEGTVTISNSYAQVTVTGSGNFVGGLVGDNYAAGGTITINSCYALGNVEGSSLVGGLVGDNYAFGGTTTISNCYAIGDVYGVDYVGGLVGDNVDAGIGSTAIINNSYALGNVEGSSLVGGLVGENYTTGGNTATISNSIAFNPGISGSSNVGRVVGSNNATVTNNYANGGMTVTGTVGSGDAGIDMTAYQFIDSTSNPYTGNWDFTNTWESNGSFHRPTLIGVGNDAGEISIAEMLGAGTVADPFQIETIEDLVAVGKASVVDGVNDYSLSSNYILNNNLDFTDDISYRDPNGLDVLDIDNDGNISELLKSALTSGDEGAGFEPIGDGTNGFTGIFDGDRHTISNLYINRNAEDYIGLFGSTVNSRIKDIGLIDVVITGKSKVGGLVGHNYASGEFATISNSYVQGVVEGAISVGGFVGSTSADNESLLTISNSYTQVVVTGSGNFAGGLVGDTRAYDSSTIEISNCYVLGDVTKDGMYVGGLVGNNYADGGTATISNCYALGNVTGSGMYVGGLVGCNYNDGGIATINKCYALGVIDGHLYVGGLVGYNYVYEGTATISNNIAFNPSVSGINYVGRVVGSNDGTATNNYANSGMTVTGTVVGNGGDGSVSSGDAGTNMTADDFSYATSNNPYSTWDFTNDWEFEDLSHRPILQGVGDDEGL